MDRQAPKSGSLSDWSPGCLREVLPLVSQPSSDGVARRWGLRVCAPNPRHPERSSPGRLAARSASAASRPPGSCARPERLHSEWDWVEAVMVVSFTERRRAGLAASAHF